MISTMWGAGIMVLLALVVLRIRVTVRSSRILVLLLPLLLRRIRPTVRVIVRGRVWMAL